MSNEEIHQLIASNAKAIEALSAALASEREERQRAYQEWEKDRNQLYQYLSRIAAAQSNFYQVQSDYYHQLAQLSERQTELQAQLSERQTRVEEQKAELQAQLSERQTRLEEQQAQLSERQIRVEERQVELQAQIVEILNHLVSDKDTGNNL